jgi:RHS repeat-associated protein
MRSYFLPWFLALSICLQHLSAAQSSISEIYLGSRESDPASLVENVSIIHGDYSEIEVDVIVPAPDSLILSRFYSSRDILQTATLGGWRFNPHCFLTVQKDPRGKNYSTTEGKFERTFAYVGNPDGSILTYVGWKNASSQKRALFKIDAEGESIGLANSARSNISSWTNLKNNELYFNPQTNSFELDVCSGAKRIYVKHPSADLYLLSYEVLPSGNKIFYEFDEKSQLTLIKETNATEKKVLGWIKIQYGNGIHIDTSDEKTVDYYFQQNSGVSLLTAVLRFDKPQLHYQYQVVDNHALLVKKELPEGRFVKLDYYTDKANKCKVKSVTTPASVNGTSTHFIYENDYTEVRGPENRKAVYRFDDRLQLTAIEHYLDGALYRVDKKYWGKKKNAGNLISTSVEDGRGNVFYCKSFIYDDKDNGDIVEEHEYGNLAGGDRQSLVLDENGVPTSGQEPHTKTYIYTYGDQEDEDVIIQKDSKGNGVEFAYKKGTNLLIRKCCLKDTSREKRWCYGYNSDGVLVQVQVDDGYEIDPTSTYFVHERLITTITPKQELPNAGAPEVIEEKYLDLKSKNEILLKRIINQFDRQGNIVLQEFYDANGEHRYSIKKGYKNGLVIFESDPIGDETHYAYDTNQNLISEQHFGSGITIKYGYDLKNRPIAAIQHGKLGEKFETHITYDLAGNKISEIDRFGNQTTYTYDDLGRNLSVTYPEIRDGEHSFKHLTYSFTYDIFNHATSVKDPKGEVTTTVFTVHGKPTEIRSPDGTRELFKYDPEGSLHRHCDREGTVKIFEYDYLGRVIHIERYGRSTEATSGDYLGDLYCTYDALHKFTEKDEEGLKTTYTYDLAGRLASTSIETGERESRKIDFAYDALGRTQSVKNWKSKNAFTLQAREYDLLNRVTEERIEDQNGTLLLKNIYTYDPNGQVGQVIGYPHNHESILTQYEYDGVERISKILDAFGNSTQILYDDHYVNQLGQNVLKRTQINALGNRKEEIYDAEGNLIKIIKKDKNNQILSETEFVYDANGNQIVEQSTVLSDGKRLRTYSTVWAYGQGDRLSSIIRAAASPDERTTTFSYNAWGDLVSKTPPGAKDPITYEYNVDGQVASISYKNPGSTKATTYQISYNRIGNIEKIKLNSNDFLTSKFNNKGQLLAESFKDEWGTYEVRSFYDGDGHIQSIQLPDASFIDYTYDGPLVKTVTRRSKDKKNLFCYEVANRDLMGHALDEILIQYAGAQRQNWDASGKRTAILNDFFQDQAAKDGFDALRLLRKRETTIEDENFETSYDYDALLALISEKGEIEHKYAYDSIGNRLKKDSSNYKINDLNEIVEADGVSYTFDASGNLETKTKGEKTWNYQSNPLNQLVQVKNPDQNVITFTYDPSGRRLTKKIETKAKMVKIYRYFYLGETEIGCLDEKGSIVELKVLGNPNQPESIPAVAFEVNKEIYVPIYDMQGNIACLVDGKRRNIVESYRYSAFGEEEIINERGRAVSDSVVGNCWRYKGKRTDKEIGLVYFGKRYYDPEIGRWTSPDPLGEIDGHNLYAYARNNPVACVDYFGLASETNDGNSDEFQEYFYGEYEPHCYCERHRDCKRGGDIGSAIGGVAHGVVDFVIGSFHDLQTDAAYIGSSELDISLQERIMMIEAIERSQAKQMALIGSRVMGMLAVDESNSLYQSFRSKTTMGLEIGSLVAGGYGAVKGGFSKLARMPVGMTAIARKSVYAIRGAESINAGVNLKKKLSQLATAQRTAVNTRFLPNGRIRYYGNERLASTTGPTRGRAYVTEFDLNTGRVRTWMECYDRNGVVNRIHPKQINGQDLISPHYPPTSRELGFYE